MSEKGNIGAKQIRGSRGNVCVLELNKDGFQASRNTEVPNTEVL